MNQCVPSWDVEDNHHPPPPHRFTLRAHSNSNSVHPDVSTLNYEMAELTWENGQLAMHGLGTPRLPNKNTWKKQPIGGGTLESVVNQATTILPHCKSSTLQIGCCDGGDELVPWFENHQRAAKAPAATSLTLTVDAMVPCSSKLPNDQEPSAANEQGMSTCVPGCSTTLVGSRGGAAEGDHTLLPRVNMAAGPQNWSIRADQSHQSVSGSATCCWDSRQVTLDTSDRELGTAAHTSASLDSPENTSSAKQCTKTVDDHDSPCQSRNEREARRKEEDKKKGNGKSSVSTKRSRAAAIHNQSERKRRDKINQRMKALQKLVPNCSKTDKASMLDEVIEYLKQLQAQLNIMSRMKMSPMMLPMALQQQQLQMSMMAPMGMGMSMGMGMGVVDMNSICRPNLPGIPPVLHPAAFMPTTSWDGHGDRLAAPSAAPIPDPLAAFLACQSQPMSMDAYSRIAALYQQCLQPPGPASKDKML